LLPSTAATEPGPNLVWKIRAPASKADGVPVDFARPQQIEGTLVAKSTGTPSAFEAGARIFHTKFGPGRLAPKHLSRRLQASWTKLSSTIFRPALSKSTVSSARGSHRSASTVPASAPLCGFHHNLPFRTGPVPFRTSGGRNGSGRG
jgi:hypothetical protein